MNEHLSANEISDWILGERPRTAQSHLRHCETCRTKVTLFENTLTEFRQSARVWSAGELTKLPVSSRLTNPHRLSLVMSGGLGAVAAAAVLLVIYLHPVHPTEQPVTPAISDAALMSQVDDALSRDVPDALTPLTKLVTWEDSVESQSDATEKRGVSR